MKRLAVFGVALTAAVSLLLAQQAPTVAALKTSPCDPHFSSCGYVDAFNGASADCNVLPGDNWCSLSDQSFLYGVTNTATFVSVMQKYLNGDYGSGSQYVNNEERGAAMLIDAMLGFTEQYNGSDSTLVNYARANFTTWQDEVESLGAAGHTCSNSPNAVVCSGTTFGINFQYRDPLSGFCRTVHHVDSGYDQGRQEPVLYPVYIDYSGDNSSADYWKCFGAWSRSQPEIVLYWNGGSSSFHIGSRCGNLQGSLSKLPPANNLPQGTISISCVDPNTGLQSAHITFRDLDAATSAYVTLNGWTSGTYGSSGAGAWATDDVSLPLPPTTNAYTKQTVTLHIQDTGPLANGAWYTWTAQSDAPCVNYGCTGANTDPDKLDPYMTYSLAVGVKPTVGQLPANPTIDIMSIVTPGGATYYSHGQVAATNSSGVEQATFTNIPKTNTTGVFTANWRLYTNGTLLKQCSGKFSVINLPYLNVYGGDVMTGAAPASGTACLVSQPGKLAGAYSWNRYGPGFGYAGAGGEYAVQALGQIEEFGSAMNPSSGNPPIDLSFANNGLPAKELNPLAQGLFGGFFGDFSGSWACTDYTKGLGNPISGAAATTQIASISPAGTNPAQINDGQQMRIYANGDVYISRNIAYQGGAWPKVDQIPLFELVVVGGNIYIDSSVTQLDGIYVAEPSGGSGGQIIDCATKVGGMKQVDPTVNGFYDTCNKKLTINGAFVAQDVFFGRTNGSLGQATAGDSLSSNHDAEVFNYTPELWLPRSATTPDDTYDAITALPPVL